MIQTYEDMNKLYLLKSHANENITPFSYTVGCSVSINILHGFLTFFFFILEIRVHLLHIAKGTSAERNWKNCKSMTN